MANMIPISTVTVGSGGASSIDFTNIPQIYTDLVFKFSGRGTATANYITAQLVLNGTSTTTNWSKRQLEGGDSTATSNSNANSNIGYPPAASMTSSTFGNFEIYIPNYAGSNNKSISIDSVGEGNSATSVYMDLIASLWSVTSPITSISITPSSGNWAQYSSATLYGIRKY